MPRGSDQHEQGLQSLAHSAFMCLTATISILSFRKPLKKKQKTKTERQKLSPKAFIYLESVFLQFQEEM